MIPAAIVPSVRPINSFAYGSSAAVIAQLGSKLDTFALPYDTGINVDGVGRVASLPDVRGSGYPLWTGGQTLGLTGSNNPDWNSSTKVVSTQNNNSCLALAASTNYNIATQNKWLVVIGALNAPAGTSCMGWINASNFAKFASLQGDFDGTVTMDLSSYTSPFSSISSGRAISTTMGVWIFEHLQPLSTDTTRALSVPPIRVESYGLLPRRLISPDQNNSYQKPPSGAYFPFVGGRFFGVGANGGDTRIMGILSGSGYLTASDKIQLYHLAQRIGASPTAPKPVGVVWAGDSRPFGNGASNQATLSVAPRFAFYKGANYDVVRHGILGMWMQEIEQQKEILLEPLYCPLRTTYVALQAGINEAFVASAPLKRTPAQVVADARSIGAFLTPRRIRLFLHGEIAPMPGSDRDIITAGYQSIVSDGDAWGFYKADDATDFQVAVNEPTGRYVDLLHLGDTGQDEDGHNAADRHTALGG